MLNYVIITAIIIISLTIMASFLYFRRGRHSGVYQIPSLATPSFRKMIDTDYQTISQYLKHCASASHNPSQTVWQIKKNATIATICNSVTRFNLGQEQGYAWRYFIDTIEVQLPSQLEPFLQRQNVMELVETDHLPLIVSMNSHSLKDFSHEWLVEPAIESIFPEAAIQERGQHNIELLRMRKETREEYRLHHSSGWLGAAIICLSFLLGYLTLISIPLLQGWGLVSAALCFIFGLFVLFRSKVFPKKYQDVKCIYGQPKRWELYGELDKKYSSTVSIGGVDLHYPAHWAPYIHHELNKPTNIDIYASGDVLKYGQYLSLHEEERDYPYKRFKKNIVMLIGALFVLALVFSYQSMSLPVKLGFAWLEGVEKITATSSTELETSKLKVGDTLSAKGMGMCYRPPNLNDSEQALFVPFDCSGVYWNNINLVNEPESEKVELSIELLNTVKNQLHPDKDAGGVNPRLQRDIMKSGMNIIFDFSQIILKTNALCQEDAACSKLKNALINLGSTDDWGTLVNKASAGKLSGAHVLLRAGSAEALENIVEATTYEFIRKEIDREVRKLNSPPPGGVLLISDENKSLVDLISGSSFNDMTQLQRWQELKRLSSILINTPFDIEGIITHLSVDANGTLYIVLHEEPNADVLSQYVCSSLFVLFLIFCALINGSLIVIRVLNNKRRLRKIIQYYDKCFEADNPSYHR
ncbi:MULTISPECIES: IgaA/UmoB family intracellular growth attenuator [Providencia]|nr:MULTISPECIES: IgaA/UmoB family intracellular growth attenuator [Providencia]MBP6123085.1 intracellular growth attenuator family protein [Providencia sp.]MDD9338797.1 IgaA/UmoB family intracellular growth attenuator [Providencia heimbachae]NIH20835.1 intracellular growth attenuator family protein [Providencia heimbachae]QCJ68489.1 flagellar operon control protein UmoB [Providencia heimbachae]